MKIKLFKNGFSRSPEFEEFITENDGKWVDVDDTLVGYNYYYVDGMAIYDCNVVAVQDDSRKDAGICGGCKARVTDFAKHCSAREAQKDCIHCLFNGSKAITDDNTYTSIDNNDGTYTETFTKSITHSLSCTHIGGCRFTKCRSAGVFFFTSDNTFFLRHPDITKTMPTIKGFIQVDERYTLFVNTRGWYGLYDTYNDIKRFFKWLDGEFVLSLVSGYVWSNKLNVEDSVNEKVIDIVKSRT